MKKLFVAFALVAVFAAPAFAKTFKLPAEDTVATVTFPDEGWDVKQEEESLDAYTSDNGIYINIETHDGDSIEEGVSSSIKYLQENKVEIDAESMKQHEGEVGAGLKGASISWSGKDADGPVKVGLIIIQVSEKKGLLFTYWASPEELQKHEAELNAVLESIKTK